MKVLLLTHIKGLGQKGDIKEVSEGYFRNKLSPEKLALPANEKHINHLKAQSAKEKEKLLSLKESAESIKSKLHGKDLEIKSHVSSSGALYAAIHEKDLAQAIEDTYKVLIPVKNIELTEHLKSLGVFKFTIKLHAEIRAEMRVNILAE